MPESLSALERWWSSSADVGPRPGKFAAKRSSTQPGHLGAQVGLIDEDKLRRIEIELTVEPVVSALQQVLRSHT